MTDEPVRVAHDSGFPPFAEVKDGKSEGLAMDFTKKAWAVSFVVRLLLRR